MKFDYYAGIKDTISSTISTLVYLKSNIFFYKFDESFL